MGARPPGDPRARRDIDPMRRRSRQTCCAALGMIGLRAASAEAAQQIVAADPGVRSGVSEFRVDPLGVFYAWHD